MVVSNDFRNRALGSILAARITTDPKPALASIVELPIGEPAIGRVLCDDIVALDRADLGKTLGALSRRAMDAVDDGLRVVLALDRD